MGFTNQERINVAAKALQAGVIDANPESVWYETFFPFTFVMSSEQIWTEMTTLRGLPAGSLANARANAAANPTLIQEVGRDAFPEDFDFQVGEYVSGQGEQGEPVTGQIVNVEGDKVTLDFNHPMAGKNLNFEITAVES